MISRDYAKLVKTWFLSASLCFAKSSDCCNAYNILICFTFSNPGTLRHNFFILAAADTLTFGTQLQGYMNH